MGRKWKLVRVGKGSSPTRSKSDVRLMYYRPTKDGRSPRIGIRVSEQCMKRQRWFPGDMINAEVDMSDDERTLTVTVSRTDDESVGVRLTLQGKKAGPSTAQFTVPQDMADAIFKGGVTGLDGRMEQSDGGASAVLVFVLA